MGSPSSNYYANEHIRVYIYIYSIESGNSQTTAMSEGVTIKTLAVKKRRCRFK